MSPYISAVVCTYGRSSILEECLEALQADDFTDKEIVVVHRPRSDDEDVNKLCLRLGMKYVRQDAVPGLSRARNIGVRQCSGEIIAFVDDDALIQPGWFEAIASSFTSKKIGGVGGRVIDVRSKHKSDEVKRHGELFEFRFPFLSKGIVYAQGCNMAYRRSALEDIGLFDEYYTFLFEDVDIAFRLNKAGYTIMQNGDMAVRHFEAQGPTRGRFYFFHSRAKYHFIFRHFDAFSVRALFIWHDLRKFDREIVRFCRSRMGGRITDREFRELFLQNLKGRVAGLLSAPNAGR